MPANKEPNGTWTSRFYITDYKGIKIQKKKRGFTTKKEALEYEREALAKSEFNTEMTFQSLYELYMEDISPRLKEYSLHTKKHIVESKILPFFKDLKLEKITPAIVRKWQNEMLQLINPTTNKPYKPTYLKALNNHLSAILNYAVSFQNLKENPCKKAGIIGKNNAEEMKIWTVKEFNIFVEHLKHKPIAYVGFHMLFHCGLRIGELLALTIKDIDFNQKTININKSYQRLKGNDIITPPKTDKSNRIINLSDELTEMLKEYLNKIYEPTPNTRLFPTTAHSFQHDIKRYSKKIGLDPIRIHDLRHSHASFLINNNVNILAISKRLGHEKIETTLNIYSHLYTESQEYMISVLNKKDGM
ncbi:site-specific integrase [Fusobacterium sp.]|uniref:site-specific integrase n=1 Tax=Fusobacterium sp. TaxID=68766 RepID=UPI0025C1B2E4|nr:site-specific integrase [Fusobacterium sp.]MCI7222952.1 site-specific integrase [Fusobacterium sp.]